LPVDLFFCLFCGGGGDHGKEQFWSVGTTLFSPKGVREHDAVFTDLPGRIRWAVSTVFCRPTTQYIRKFSKTCEIHALIRDRPCTFVWVSASAESVSVFMVLFFLE
jgi:hypothetical protein